MALKKEYLESSFFFFYFRGFDVIKLYKRRVISRGSVVEIMIYRGLLRDSGGYKTRPDKQHGDIGIYNGAMRDSRKKAR